MATRMQQRRGTAAQWTSANPILASGEIGFETDTGQFKIGDGSSPWASLPYFKDVVDGDFIPLSQKGAESGVATLDSDGKIPSEQLPAISITEVFVASTEEAMLALDAQGGDVAVRTDLSKSFILAGSDPSVLANWQELLTPTDQVTSVNGQTGTVILETDNIEEPDGATNLWFTDDRAVVATNGVYDPIGSAATAQEAAESYADSLAVNYDPAGSAQIAEDNANSYTVAQLANYVLISSGNGAGGYAELDINGEISDFVIPSNIVRNSELLNYVPTSEKGAVSGVAELDASGYVPDAQISSDIARTADFIPLTEKGAVEGIAELDIDGYVPDTQISPDIARISDVTSAVGDYIALAEKGASGGVAELDINENVLTSTSVVFEGTTVDLNQTTLVATDPTDTRTITLPDASGTVALVSDLTAHEDDTTNVHGIADTSLLLTTAGGTLTGFLTLHAEPTQALHAATKDYVDNVASGILAKPSVDVATTANVTATYNNGTAGVGSTLTIAPTATLDIDGKTSWAQYDSVLFKNQTSAFQNGRYVLTTVGDGSNSWIFTRCGLCDEADEIPGSYMFVTDGTVNGQTAWVLHVDDPATFVVGTDDIDAYQFSGAGSYNAGDGLILNGNIFSVDTTVIAPLNSPTFTGTVSGITKSMVGLGNVDNTSDADKPVSTATQTALDTKQNKLVSTNAQSSGYTLVLSDADKLIEMSGGGTLTIPADAAVNFPVGTSINIVQTGASQVTIAGSGFTPNGTPGLKLRAQWSVASIIKRGTNSWLVFGDLAA